jgi:hypothetical protein
MGSLKRVKTPFELSNRDNAMLQRDRTRKRGSKRTVSFADLDRSAADSGPKNAVGSSTADHISGSSQLQHEFTVTISQDASLVKDSPC